MVDIMRIIFLDITQRLNEKTIYGRALVKMITRLRLPILILSILMLAVVNRGWTAPSENSQSSIKRLEERILNQENKILRIEKGISNHKSMIRTSREKEFNLLEELEGIDTRIDADRKKLGELRRELTEQEARIREKQQELSRTLITKEKVQEHVERRLAAYYGMGSVGIMNVVFSASALPDLLNFEEYFHHVTRHDEEVIHDYKSKVSELDRSRQALEDEKQQLILVIKEVTEQEKRLALARQERIALLARINTEKKLYQRALGEMENAAENLADTLESLEKEAGRFRRQRAHGLTSPKKRRPSSRKGGFAGNKGWMDPPVTGTVVTRFGRNTRGKFGITSYARGINIKVEPGTPIKAVYHGRVVYAGQLRGYGKLIIIDHDQQYYSLASKISELYKKEGDTVVRGEIIGITGESGDLLGEGLHFEIRHGTEPENPLSWLNNAGLKIRAVQDTSDN